MLKEIKLRTFLTMCAAYAGKVCVWVGEQFVFVNSLFFNDSQSTKCLCGVTSLQDHSGIDQTMFFQISCRKCDGNKAC